MIDSYEKLTISKYKEILALDRNGDAMEFLLDELEILSDYTVDELLTMPIPQFKELSKKSQFLREKPNFSSRCPKSIKINGEKYSIDTDVKNMSVGQYIDYKQYYKEPEDLMKNLDYIMTIFIIPSGHKYGDGYDLEALAKLIGENLSIQTAIQIRNFFFLKLEKSIKCFLTYLSLKMKREIRKTKNQETKTEMEKALKEIQGFQDLLKDGFLLTGVLGSEKYMVANLMKYSTLIS